MKIPCPNCEYGKVEMEVRRTRDGDFITAWDECPVCHGSAEVDAPRNLVEEVQVVSDLIFICRNNSAAMYDTIDHKHSAKRLERLLTDLVENGEYSMVYEGLTRGTVTFHPAELPY